MASKEKATPPKWPPDHPYAYTIGDVEYREVNDHKDGQTKKMLFALNTWPETEKKKEQLDPSKAAKQSDKKGKKDGKKDKKKEKEKPPIRKVFVSFKVKRVSDIDNVEEQFRVKFHLYFNWLPTYDEYLSYCETSDEELYKWEPRWYPHLEFMNQIEPIEPFPRWEEYPDEGRFRLKRLKGFFDELCDDRTIYDPNEHHIKNIFERKSIGEWNWKDAYFIRGKYDVEMLLSEELELQSFPFDCQDLSIIMRENTRSMNIAILPEMRKVTFGSIDPRYSVIDEWDMESARIEFGATNAGASRAGTSYPSIILRLKMKRRWEVFMWNIVLLVLCIECLAITAFALDLNEEASDRLGLSITLVLTAVAFLHIVKSGLPNVPYLTFLDFYVLSSYVFLMSIMMETAILSSFEGEVPKQWDNAFMVICIIYQVAYHVVFFFYSMHVRKQELLKLVMDSDSIEDDVNQSRPALAFDYRTGSRQGDRGRLLYFKAGKKQSKDDAKSKDDKGKPQEEKPLVKKT
eukprot:314369_1